MFSSNKLASPSQISKNDISRVISSNVLGHLLQYVNLNSLPTVGKANKKFKRVIWKEKKIPLFDVYIEERNNSRSIKDVSDVFCEKDLKTSYISH